MGQVLTKVIKFNSEVRDFNALMEKVGKLPDMFDIRRKEYLEKNKYVINFAYRGMVAENTGLFRTTSFARFQIIFTLVEPKILQMATEYGFIGSASRMADADKINDIIEKYLNGNTKDDVIDADFKEAKREAKEDPFIASADKLLKAKELYEKGAISFDEYESLKDKFMSDALK